MIDRMTVINNLEKRFGDIYTGEAINLNTATSQVLDHLKKGIKLEEIRLTMLGKKLLVGIMRSN